MARTMTYNVEVDSGDSVKTLGTLRDELEQINEELENVAVGSKEFVQLSDRARKVGSEIKTLEKTFEGLEPQQKTEAFVKGFEGIAGAVAVTAGSLQLFGVESERIGKLEEKVQGAIAIAIGARSVAEGALQARIAARLIQEKAVTVATKAQIVAQRALNLVLNANPLGLVIAAVTAGVVIFTKFGDTIKSFIADRLEPLNRVLEKVGKFLRRVGSAIGLVASEEELAAEKMEQATNARIKNIERELKVRQAAGEDTIELERQLLDEKMKLYDKDSDEYKDLVADKQALEAGYQKSIDDANAAAAQKRKEEREKELAEEKAANDKKLEEEKRLQEEKLKVATGFAKEAANEARFIDKTEFERKLIELEEEFTRRKEILQAQGIDTTNLEAVFANQREEIVKAEEDRKLQAKKDADDKAVEASKTRNSMEMQLAQERVDAAFGVANALVSIAGSLFENSKGVAIAQTAINTAQSVQGIYASAFNPLDPTPFGVKQVLAIAQIAASVASGVKQISDIRKATPEGGATISGGGGGRPTGGGTPLSLGTVQGDSILTPTNIPQQQTNRAYVVAGDVTSEQEAQAKLNSRRTL